MEAISLCLNSLPRCKTGGFNWSKDGVRGLRERGSGELWMSWIVVSRFLEELASLGPGAGYVWFWRKRGVQRGIGSLHYICC